MEPKYSILLCNESLAVYENRIKQWLTSGIKVLWFSKNAADVSRIKETFQPFAKAFLLISYVTNLEEKLSIVDGEDPDDFVERKLSKDCPYFNSAQYLVEHCKASEHIIVQASAGTGKTTVMIDRIMYLMHMIPNLKLSEIYMITFTNDAADQMNRRLQDTLMRRYRLTHQKRYLRWVEEQSQMNISTIHSFAYCILKEFGIAESFTKKLAIRSFQYEKRELIKDTIDAKIDENHSVRNQLGVPFYRANSIVNEFWTGFSKLGISRRDIGNMNWGKPLDADSVPFQNLMLKILEDLDAGYLKIKRERDAVSIDDIMRDLQDVLQESELPNTDISMKYLFIDEFQDSDLSQIKVACLLVQLLSAKLFVVGDVKQSIYRFRGATDQAFAVLKRDLGEIRSKAAKEFTLVNNYRTSANVMNRMERYFAYWGRMGRLQYDKPVLPFNQEPGRIRMIPGASKEIAQDQIAEVASNELNALIDRVEQSGQRVDEKTRVVLLTRSNNELSQLAGILRRNKIPASIKRDGSFFASEAVRDFYIMVCSFLFCDEPKYIFNYLLTPYAGEITPMNLNDMEWLHGDYENLVSYLDRYLDQTTWKKYHKDLRLKPVLSVFKDMLDNVSVMDNYILNAKARKKADGWEEERCIASTFTEARQYQANLEKLMELLQRNLGGDKVSIYDVYHYLKLNIATNRSEGEASVESTDDYTSVLCMTVHKSKGLEFDTVILPYTNREFPTWATTEILIDPVERKVGWNYTGDTEKKNKTWKYSAMKNDLYDKMKEAEKEAIKQEETRILYVAMTRAIRNLICIVPSAKNSRTWAYLFEEVGIDYE